MRGRANSGLQRTRSRVIVLPIVELPRDYLCLAPAGAGTRRLRFFMRALAAEAKSVGPT
jgi:hypothetical protein